MRGIRVLLILTAFGFQSAAHAGRIEFGFGPSQPALNDRLQPWAVGTAWHMAYIHPLAAHWDIVFSGGYARFLNDTTSKATVRFLLPNRLADQNWRVRTLTLGAQYRFASQRSTSPYLRLALASAFWDVQALGGGTLRVEDADGALTDFAGREMLVCSAAGLHYQIHPRVGMAVEAELTYFTGLGTDFSPATDEGRSRAIGTAYLKLTYDWPARYPASEHPAEARPRSPPTVPYRALPATAAPADSDGDGIADDLDHCPGTPPAASGWVDVYGCPVDSDRDGVPDFLDLCAGTGRDAPVDSAGCVPDSDGDGVPDLLDRCAGTAPGVEVDAAGCPNYPPLADKIVFRFSYPSGGADLDAEARAQLGSLLPTLRYNPDLKIRVEGYTDSVGPADANMALAQKRADRVRTFLIGEGIPADRIVAVGRGEVDFVASNDTREGRAQNRRIEIVPVR